jgi:pre-mRNA-splicing helicase BRR2
LARATDQEEREKIEEEIKGLDLQHILDQLHAMKASPMERQKNLENSIREEAQRLKDGDKDMDRNKSMRGVGE